ncbi:putative endodeoxyribonuclease [Leuconostoc phage phiLN12]|uniref:Putative endodeoxyribonuclease n=1 Tax=Leuconostoc phage phiLN12 TaxID=1262517 RepID=A0A059PAG8_9CAUD|nr:RusA-like Holliday junction resolvase [Leuconostoc phage phiLN12]AFY98330.1 putative endodeoxyribonuclease [Leuconostoc phage phiLN12]
MEKLTFKIETRLINWNEVAQMAYSKDSTKYSRTKKRQQTFIKHEITNQLADIHNYFGENQTSVNYEWHTSTKFDLGNIAAGEKFIADSINELSIWSDDRYIHKISHIRVEDEENYVLVTISGKMTNDNKETRSH